MRVIRDRGAGRLRHVVLWLGLLLCGYAMWRARSLGEGALARLDFAGWGGIALLLTAIWWLAVLAWRQYLLAYTGRTTKWRVVMRQLGLLLVGKYIPGGVFGFLARVYDQPEPLRARLVWAGLAEQAVGLGMSSALGVVLYLAASREALAWVCLVPILPLLAVSAVGLLHRFGMRAHWLRRYADASALPSFRDLFLATTTQLMQLAVWGALVFMLARELYGVDGFMALGVSSAFLLAVVAGMLVVFTPGGIGVREVAMVGLAAPWLDTAQAVFLAALLRLLSSLLDVFSGGVAAVVAAGDKRQKQ